MKIKIRLIVDLGNVQVWSCRYVSGLVDLGFCFGVFNNDRLLDAYVVTNRASGKGILSSWLFSKAYGSARKFNREIHEI